MVSKILLRKAISYTPVKIRIDNPVYFAKAIGWQCDVFNNRDTLYYFLIQAGWNWDRKPLEKIVDEAALQILDSGIPVVRLLTVDYSAQYCSLNGFNIEDAAEDWLKKCCKVYASFNTVSELMEWSNSYCGQYQEEMKETVEAWLRLRED